MSLLYHHDEHPHIKARKLVRPVTLDQHRPRHNALARLNTKVGVGITVAVGTMWAAYAFTLLALVSLPSAWQSGDKIIIVAWIAQTFLQLVLLPIIIVGQNVQGAASDARAKQTYDDAEAVLHQCLEIEKHLQSQDAVLGQLIAGLTAGSKPA